LIWNLFSTFFFIGAFSFGGGYAMIPLIQQEIVYKHAWLTSKQFADIIAVSQMTPGPIAINAATYVGYKINGFWGSVFATAGVALPSFILILTLANIILRNKNNPYFKGAFNGLRPVVVALIVGAGLLLWKETITGVYPLFLTIIGLLIMYFTEIHPILILLAFGLLGIFI
jgi:chromate transporter